MGRLAIGLLMFLLIVFTGWLFTPFVQEVVAAVSPGLAVGGWEGEALLMPLVFMVAIAVYGGIVIWRWVSGR